MKILPLLLTSTALCHAEFNWKNQSWTPQPKAVDATELSLNPSPRQLIIAGNKTPFAKDGKYHRVRVPVAAVSKSGSILIASEGRLGANPDHPPGTDRDWDHILLSRSTDNGKTWTTHIIEKGEDTLDIGALSICADKKNDKLFILAYCANKGGEVLIFESKGDGHSWTKHHQSGSTFHGGPKNQALRMRPTNGIQLSPLHGEDGNIILPGVIGYGANRMMGLLTYSPKEDKWRVSETFDAVPNPTLAGEMTVAEMDKDQTGSLLFITRPETKIVGKMKSWLIYSPGKEQISPEGWVDSAFSFKRCNQNLSKYSFDTYHNKSRLLFSSTKNLTGKRLGGHLSVSYNNGKTWRSKDLLPNTEQFGYSQVLSLPDGTVGIVYEGQNAEGAPTTSIYFKRATLSWLTDGKDKGLSTI